MPAKRRGFVGNIYIVSMDDIEITRANEFANAVAVGSVAQIAAAKAAFQQVFAFAAGVIRVPAVMDIKLNDAWKTFDGSDRGSTVMKYLPAMQEWSLEFSIILDLTNAQHLLFQVAYRNQLPITLWVADGKSGEIGTSGPLCDWLITDFPKDMPLGDGLKVAVKGVPHANHTFEPVYLEAKP